MLSSTSVTLIRVKGKDPAMLLSCQVHATAVSHKRMRPRAQPHPPTHLWFLQGKKSKNQVCRQEPDHRVSPSMMAGGLVKPDLAFGTRYRHDPRQGGEASKEKKTIGETHVLAGCEKHLCQQSFVCNTCSEDRWEFSAWICSRQLAIQRDDSGLSVPLQAKAAQTLLRQNFHFS